MNIRLSTPSEEAYSTMNRIFSAFSAGQRLIAVNTALKLTKTHKGLSDALLLNDVDLSADVKLWIDRRSSEATLLDRYGVDQLPAQGSICSGQNIFLFFPECLGVPGRRHEDFFGIELIDIWANIFQKTVLPCARATFSADSQLEFLTQIGVNLDKTIYLAAIFHELGHRKGAWRVSPSTDPRLKVSSFYLDVFGEMSTDSYLVGHLREFPEIAAFVVLQRLFWFGRRGFRDNPLMALINHDNDSWLSAFLWNRLREGGALERDERRWTIHTCRLDSVFQNITDDLETLGEEVLTFGTKEEQDLHSLNWMKAQVAFVDEAGFVLPLELREVYRQCSHIEEIPHFQPLAESFDLRRIS